jgi:signal transduction histidine kinase
VPGSDPIAKWRAGLLADGHGIPVVALRAGRVHAANRAAHRSFASLRLGMDAGRLFDESCRAKLRELLEHGDSGAIAELETMQTDRPPIATRVLLLALPGEQLMVMGGSGIEYTEEIGAKLMAANTDLSNLTRELSRRMHELDAARGAMQKLAELREMFIAALAHDLKAPLSVILLSESLLRKNLISPQPVDVERHVDKVERSAKRMLKLIDSLLFAVHLDAAEPLVTRSLEVVYLDEVARESAEDLAPLADDAGVRIVVNAPEPVRVRGNRAWFGQVFANLLTNAVRYSPAGKSVELTVGTQGSEAQCAVADIGPGVAPAERERVFDRFVQRGERRGSMGLGLYICRKIVDLHSGHIWVEDNPGGGARFRFRIPVEV